MDRKTMTDHGIKYLTDLDRVIGDKSHERSFEQQTIVHILTRLDKRVIDLEIAHAATTDISPQAFSAAAQVQGNGLVQNGFVAMNTWGSLNAKPTGVIGPDSNAKTIMDYKNFIEALLDLDCYALNVTEEVRNAARKVLGR